MEDGSGIWLWEPQEANGIYACFVDVKRLWGGDDRESVVRGLRPEVSDRRSEGGSQKSEDGVPKETVVEQADQRLEQVRAGQLDEEQMVADAAWAGGDEKEVDGEKNEDTPVAEKNSIELRP